MNNKKSRKSTKSPNKKEVQETGIIFIDDETLKGPKGPIKIFDLVAIRKLRQDQEKEKQNKITI